jgi:hypothetical protein
MYVFGSCAVLHLTVVTMLRYWLRVTSTLKRDVMSPNNKHRPLVNFALRYLCITILPFNPLISLKTLCDLMKILTEIVKNFCGSNCIRSSFTLLPTRYRQLVIHALRYRNNAFILFYSLYCSVIFCGMKHGFGW